MQLSAYVDDELPQNEAELLLRRLSQDVKLRQEVAEYLAIGRVMRGEVGVAGIDGIRNRVLAAIDDTAGTTDAVMEKEPATRALKPLVGVAIAATVALAAIFGLQQTTGVDDVALQDGNPLRVEVVPDYAPQQDLLRQYFLSHGETSSQLGANGMKSRLVTLRFSEELIDATVRGLVEGVETNPEAVDTDGTTTQP